MKKAYILTSIITCAVMASTHGTTEFFVNTTKGLKKDFKVNEIGIKSELNVEGTGFSFGGTFKGKNIFIPLDKNLNEHGEQKYVVDTFFNNSNIFFKYDLPKIKGVSAYVKTALNPKVEERTKPNGVLTFNAGNVELEGDLSFDVKENVKLGLNSMTKFPFKKVVEGYVVLDRDNYKKALMNYGANVESTHKAYLEAFITNDEASKEGLKDVKAHVALTHAYSQNEYVTKGKRGEDLIGNIGKNGSELVNKSLKSLELHGEGVYSKNSFEIKPEFNFKYQFDGKINTKEYVLGNYELFKESMKAYETLVASSYYGQKGLSENFFIDSDNGNNKNSKGNTPKKYDDLYKDMLKRKKEYNKTKSDDNLKKLNYAKQNLKTFDEYSYANAKMLILDPMHLNLGGYVVSFALNNKYSLNAGTDVNIKPFVNYININVVDVNDKYRYVYYGVDLGVENTSLIKNLTLKANSTLGGLTYINVVDTKRNAEHFGLISFGLGAKYDYKMTDKFMVSPKIDNTVNFFISKEKTLTNLVLEPKVSASYMPSNNLTIEGEISLPIKFGDKLVHTKENDKYTKTFKFGYKGTKIKTALNIKYEW